LRLNLNEKEDVLNYHQIKLVCEGLNFIIKGKTSDSENKLLIEAWEALKTRTYYDESNSKEGVTF
jgi:hypothetical protein